MSVLADKTVRELLDAQIDIEAQTAALTRDKELLQAELDRRFGAEHKAALAKAGKTAGTITSVLPNAGGLRLKAETRAKVKWDQPKLWSLAADMTRDQIEHYCKIELTPKEAVYKALEPGSNIKGALADARTDEPGTTTYRLLAEGEK
jgi:hypothetical protein